MKGYQMRFTVLLCIVVLGCSTAPRRDVPAAQPTARTTKVFYTVDDGKTFFADEGDKLAPFDNDGKEAVRAHVYSCDNGKTRFVGYLERLTPGLRQRLGAANLPEQRSRIEAAEASGHEIKKPLEAGWTSMTEPKAQSIREVKCPDGATVREVTP